MRVCIYHVLRNSFTVHSDILNLALYMAHLPVDTTCRVGIFVVYWPTVRGCVCGCHCVLFAQLVRTSSSSKPLHWCGVENALIRVHEYGLYRQYYTYVIIITYMYIPMYSTYILSSSPTVFLRVITRSWK